MIFKCYSPFHSPSWILFVLPLLASWSLFPNICIMKTEESKGHMIHVSIALPRAKEHKETYSSTQFNLELNVGNLNEKLTLVRVKEPARRGKNSSQSYITSWSYPISMPLTYAKEITKSTAFLENYSANRTSKLLSSWFFFFLLLGIKSFITWHHQAYWL